MAQNPVRILLIEDDDQYADFMRHVLHDVAPSYHLDRVASLAAGIHATVGGEPDAVLLDLGLPDSQGISTVTDFVRAAPGPAVVVLTSTDDPVLADRVLLAGAQDYIVKSDADAPILARALRYAIERQRARIALQQKDDAFRRLFAAAPFGILAVDTSGIVTMWNPAAERLFGWAAAEVVGGPLPYVIDETREAVNRRLRRAFSGQSVPPEETKGQCKDGRIIDILISASPVYDGLHRVVGATAMFKDITTRKQAEEAVRESERRYRLLFEANPQPMWVFDAGSLAFLAVNEAAVRAYGYSRREFLSMTIEDIRPPEELPRLREAMADPSAASGQWVWRHRRKDGGLIDVMVFSHEIEFKGRRAWLVLSQDVTERLASERRGRLLADASELLGSVHAEETLSGLASLATSTICDVASICLVSERGSVEQAHFSIPDPATHARHASALPLIRDGSLPLPPVYREVLASGSSHLARCVAGEDGAQYWSTPEEQPGEPDTRVHSAIVVAIPGTDRVLGVIALLTTVSERQYDARDLVLAEDLARRIALAIENSRLYRQARELFDDDLTGNFVAASDGCLVECNAAFARLMGFADTGTALEQVNAVDFLGGLSAWRAFVADLSRNRRLGPYELALRDAGGRPVHVLASAIGIVDRKGALVRVRGHVYDLSAHKRLEEQLNQSQKIEAVGRLAGGIAHDFNNLLLIIGGQGERLLEEMPEASPLRHNTESILRATARAARLTQQLLAFSRRQVLAPQVLNLNDIVVRVHEMIERLIGEDVTCVLDLAPAVKLVQADPGQLEQVLVNLAVNSRDAMPGGGTLTIGTSEVLFNEEQASAHLGLRPGMYVRLSVSDTGCGMDAQTRALMFEPFFTTKEVGKGTGLGLSMVYGIVKQSGGYIMAHSEVGVGTMVEVFLPVASRVPAADAPRAVPAAVEGGTETVLLVEDEDGVRELLDEILSDHGYRVLAAAGPAEAMAISAREDLRIDLLLTDVVMPEMGGRELAARLAETRPDLRVLFMSGYTDDAPSRHIVADGTAFLQKPFGGAELARKVRETLAAGV